MRAERIELGMGGSQPSSPPTAPHHGWYKIPALTTLFQAMATAATPTLYLILFFAAAVTTASNLHSIKARSDDYTCVYTIYIRTGSIWKGGTDSKISVALAGSDGWGVEITDLEDWGGLMGDGYNYFERGNLDIFSGRGPCLSTPLCWLNLTSDGSGPHHGWYCNYVEITTTGPHVGCFQHQFTIEQWLATDTSPYKLYATKDECPDEGEGVFKGPLLLRPAFGGRRKEEEVE